MKFLQINLPQKSRDFGLLVIRLAAGFFMIYGHGFGKLTRLFGLEEIAFADPFGLGPVIPSPLPYWQNSFVLSS